MIIFLTLFIHLALCVLTILTAGLRLINIRLSAFVFMVGVPVFGPVSILLLGIGKRLRKDGQADIQVDRFQLEAQIYSAMGMPNDEPETVVTLEEAMILNSSHVRRSLIMDLMKEHVVPLEEALSVSPSDVRRKLMMDVLTSDTSAFYSLMEQARMNDDVEVVHYATTAMTELNKKYDITLQKYREACHKDPQDLNALSLYCDCLEQYLALGLVKGRVEQSRRQELIAGLQILTDRTPSLERCDELAQQYLLAEDYARAEQIIDRMEALWLTSENYWMRRIEYYVRRKDGTGLRKTLYTASANGIYLSSQARNNILFWRKPGIHSTEKQS